MKMRIIKITTLFGIIGFLASCSLPDFYRFQGLNTSECGPAVACMTSSLNGQRCQLVSDARETNTQVKYWNFIDIKHYLASRGIGADLDTLLNDDESDVFIYKVKYLFLKPHFVLVTNKTVYDPFFGVYAFDSINDNQLYAEHLTIKNAKNRGDG